MKLWRALANGIKSTDGGNHLFTYHPEVYYSSGEGLPPFQEDWLDINMYQSGHQTKFAPIYKLAEKLQNISPIKPFVDGEPAYEYIPVDFVKYLNHKLPKNVLDSVMSSENLIVKTGYFDKGFISDHSVRVHAYWDFLSGACGYTYGHNSIYQMFEKSDRVLIPCLTDWRTALNSPGAESMRYVKKLFEARPFYLLRPDSTLIAGDNTTDSLHICAAIAKDASFMLVYSSFGQELNVGIKSMGNRLVTSWYNPRNGEVTKIGKIRNTGIVKFKPPTSGTGNDWMLILDSQKVQLKKL